MVHEYVLRVRVALGDAALISTRAPGYTVAPAAGELDAACFDELVQAARRAREEARSEDALRSFDEALGLWRGDALATSRWRATRARPPLRLTISAGWLRPSASMSHSHSGVITSSSRVSSARSRPIRSMSAREVS